MALVDVSELLSDPDFVDPIEVITRVPTVDGLGQNSVSESTLSSFGSVQSVSGKELERIPEALRNLDVRSFFFKGTITATSPGKYSSVLVFRGARFQVKHVNDWSNYGAGYCEGFCVAEVPAA